MGLPVLARFLKNINLFGDPVRMHLLQPPPPPPHNRSVHATAYVVPNYV